MKKTLFCVEKEDDNLFSLAVEGSAEDLTELLVSACIQDEHILDLLSEVVIAASIVRAKGRFIKRIQINKLHEKKVDKDKVS